MLANAINWFIGLGSTVFIPIIIIILGLIVKVKPSKAIIAGITVGIGFIGLSMVTGFLTETLSPAITLMVERYNLSLSIMDIGSGTAGPCSFSTVLGVIVIPMAFAINLLLIWLGCTKTLNVDVWNLWQPALIGIMVWGLTKSLWIGILAMVPAFLIELLLADVFQPTLSKFFGFPGIAITHVMALSGMVLAKPMDWIFDKIPGLNKLDADPEKIQEKFGLLGDPIMIGFLIGCIIAIFAGYGFGETLTLGIEMAAVLKILPKMVSLFMEGLSPIADGVQAFAQKYMHNKQVNIGMDAALIAGNPYVMATSLLLIPITLFIAVILPGNKVLPFGDLPTLVFALACLVAVFKGNLVRSILGCSIYTISMLYLATWLAPYLTTAYQLAGYNVGSGIITYVSAGLWPNALMVFIAKVFSVPGLLIITAILLGLLVYVNKIRPARATKAVENEESELEMALQSE